jgi:hypothetical protein
MDCSLCVSLEGSISACCAVLPAASSSPWEGSTVSMGKETSQFNSARVPRSFGVRSRVRVLRHSTGWLAGWEVLGGALAVEVI